MEVSDVHVNARIRGGGPEVTSDLYLFYVGQFLLAPHEFIKVIIAERPCLGVAFRDAWVIFENLQN